MYTYTGKNDEHLMHVPARDLSDDEFAALAPELQEAVRGAAFYQLKVQPAPKAAPKTAPADEALKVEAKA